MLSQNEFETFCKNGVTRQAIDDYLVFKKIIKFDKNGRKVIILDRNGFTPYSESMTKVEQFAKQIYNKNLGKLKTTNEITADDIDI